MPAAGGADNARSYNGGMDARGSALGLSVGPPLRGALAPPGSKSIAQRALLAAALAQGRTLLLGLPDGEDVAAALELVAALGCAPRPAAGGGLELRGRPPAAGGPRLEQPLPVGESGTLARLATAAVALCAAPGVRVTLEARGTLLRRSSAPLFEALRAAGAGLQGTGWPVTVQPAHPPSSVRLVAPVSSQEVSALLLALGAWPGERRIEVAGAIPSRPYVELTRSVLGRFGLRVDEAPTPDGCAFGVHGPLAAPSAPLAVEPDASLAAVALAAGCLSGGEVHVPGLESASAQGDVRILEHLRAFGCRAAPGPDGLRAGGLPVQAARLDLAGEPDLAPVLAIVAAAAALHAPAGAARSLLTGLGTLPGKESSRIEVLARGLASCGWEVEAGVDSLAVGPARGDLRTPRRLDPQGDHRMAFAFALLGLLRADVLVAQPGCVAKSWPRFWDDLRALGARMLAG